VVLLEQPNAAMVRVKNGRASFFNIGSPGEGLGERRRVGRLQFEVGA